MPARMRLHRRVACVKVVTLTLPFNKIPIVFPVPLSTDPSAVLGKQVVSDCLSNVSRKKSSRQHWSWRTSAFFILSLACMPGIASTLSIGPFNEGVYSGSTPFNTMATCTNPGDDCGDTDLRVRSADIISYAWSITAANIPANKPNFESVILEQTIRPGLNAAVLFNEIPTACLAPPAGPGGTNPVSTLTENPDGSSTLMCNLGSMGNGDQLSLTVPVRPLASSLNDSTFSTSQFVYALDASGYKLVVDIPYVDSNDYVISAAPAWDLIGTNRPIYNGGVMSDDVGTGRGIEKGYYLWTTVALSADSARAGKGISQLGTVFAFDSIMTATTSDGVTPYPFEYKVSECIPNPSEWGNSVWGNDSIKTDQPQAEHVVDSGTCEISGSATTGWHLTIKNADTSGSRYPTQTIDDSSLTAGPFFSMSHRVKIFVPFSEIERENINESGGALNVSQCFDNFDPSDLGGVSNYGSSLEPGANDAVMPDGSSSNNCSGPLTLEISASGWFSQFAVTSTSNNGDAIYAPLITGYHAGDGRIEPDISYAQMSNTYNSSNVDLNNPEVCLAFDNTTQILTDRGEVGATAGTYAYPIGLWGANSSDWVVEYAKATIDSDDPLDADGDGIANFNAVSGRYEGDWSELIAKSHNCDDSSLVWNTDPEMIGFDNINLVRVRALNAETALEAGEQVTVVTPLKARDMFNGGPYAGEAIPAGVVLPSFGSFRTDEVYPYWLQQTYSPSPETTSTYGDRMTFTRAIIDITNSTISPASPAGIATSTLAGNAVIWSLQPVVSSTLETGASAENVVIIDVLQPELSYDQSCTLSTDGGTPPTNVAYNTPLEGETTLSWSLGSLSSQSIAEPIIFCTQTDPTVPAGTSVANIAYAVADNAIRSPSAIQSVTLGQAGSMQASTSVDVPTDLTGDTQEYTLKLYNFSNTGSVSPPTVINVLPHIGDGSSESASSRDPASEFSGTLTLVDEPTITFADGSLPGSGDAFAQIGTFYYTIDKATSVNHDPDENYSNWCEYNGTSFINPSVSGGSCAESFDDVTAIKHVSNFSLEPNGSERQGLIMNYTLQATDNKSTDQYVNVFGLDSASLPVAQYVKSQNSTVTISSFSIGYLAFVDINNNGVYDEAIDLPAPNGTTIELREYDSNALVASTVTVNGNYLFSGLSAGDYYVQIPATLFTANSGLLDWTAALNGQPANTDENRTVDHNAIVLGSTTSNGILTDVITLSAQPAAVGQAPSGDEPTSDNIISIADYNTNDDFSNLTIDLGLVSGDADSDGIPDVYEFGPQGIAMFQDSDGDAIPDYLDADSDNDGVPDALEHSGNSTAPVDADGDGIANYRDIDADNDGILDGVEAAISGEDSDNDGISDEFDVDSTGGIDADANGLDDAVELAGLVDTDADGIADIHDLDSDNDGLTDTNEAGGYDTDGNGLIDGFTDINGDGMEDTGYALPLDIDDTDGDGIANFLDLDSDGDGIPDAVEAFDADADVLATGVDTDGNSIVDVVATGVDTDGDGIDDAFDTDNGGEESLMTDTDGDGTPDYLDSDDDNDGFPDALEGTGDMDSDGIQDFLDDDSDYDGIPDSLEGTVDTDSDATPDYLDTDSDNDGISDAIEAGENPAAPVDTDEDGIPDYVDQDSDNDGIDDSIELAPDTDGDGIADFQDIDSDSDGIPDAVEVSDMALTNGLPADTDRDGVPDYQDTDSDNDGISDALEAAGYPDDIDTDGDVIPDYLELDSDGDGIPDVIEVGSFLASPSDTDGDGIADYLDLDADNDGILDAVEVGINSTQPVDTDEDGVPDFLDIDSDNDGIEDFVEGVVDADANGVPDYQEVPVVQVDSDGDGIFDSIEGAGGLGVSDTDGDGFPDHLDTDSDNDGIPDSVEIGSDLNNPVDTDADGISDLLDLDSDGDGLLDSLEGKVDTDGDGLPNFLDLDSENDGLPDVWESAGTEADIDGDGMLDDNIDLDRDGVADSVYASTQLDTDNDGVANHLDIDSDGDGAFDVVEAGGEDLNGDGRVDQWLNLHGNAISDIFDVNVTGGEDIDGDGIDDFADADFVSLPDTDGDGIVDQFDLDNLGDGFLPVLVGGEAVSPFGLPDEDGDNIPDVLDVPELGAALAQGTIKTGLVGSGCSTRTVDHNGRLDPMLALLVAIAAMGAFRRRKLRAAA